MTSYYTNIQVYILLKPPLHSAGLACSNYMPYNLKSKGLVSNVLNFSADFLYRSTGRYSGPCRYSAKLLNQSHFV